MNEKEVIYCPVNGWDCPFWRKDGSCHMMEDEGWHPKDECDDYYAFWGDNDGEDWPDDVDETNYNPFMGCDDWED